MNCHVDLRGLLHVGVIALRVHSSRLVQGPFREIFRDHQFGQTCHLLHTIKTELVSGDIHFPSVFLECSANFACCLSLEERLSIRDQGTR